MRTTTIRNTDFTLPIRLKSIFAAHFTRAKSTRLVLPAIPDESTQENALSTPETAKNPIQVIERMMKLLDVPPSTLIRQPACFARNRLR